MRADGDPTEPPPQRGGHPLSPGDVVAGRYRIVRALGRGSFGHTYLAVDTAAGDREVAVKQLRTDGDRGWKAFELFEREAAALRSLRHHGIPEIFAHLRETDDALIAYLVMEYIDGVSLEQRIDDGASLDPAALLRVALGLLDILEYLHTRVPPVLHRDIKPANILLRPDGAPVLVDFGAVRTVFRAAGEGGSTVVGTFGYMPLEQTMGQASPASDLYAVGATLLHLITRRPPSEFATRDGVIEVPADLPGGAVVRGVIARLLAPAASARYQSAREVREALLAPVVSSATAPAPSVALAPIPPTTFALASTPRAIEGELRTRFEQVTLSPARLLFADQHPSQPVSLPQRGLLLVMGLISLGIVPLIIWIFYNARCTRARPFFLNGVPVSGRILQVQKTEWIQVTYEFVHAGATHRGVDTIIPAVAGRWQPGDVIELLVLPERNHDSIIITST